MKYRIAVTNHTIEFLKQKLDHIHITKTNKNSIYPYVIILYDIDLFQLALLSGIQKDKILSNISSTPVAYNKTSQYNFSIYFLKWTLDLKNW